MESTLMQYPPGDPRMIDTIVNQLKSQGIFDQFRKECIADVDTKPAYQNLHQRVEGTVSGFLAHQIWRPDLNKNQLRESLRKHIHESGFLDMGVERIVDQVVNPKIVSVLVPQVEDVVYKFIGVDKPKKSADYSHAYPSAPYHHVDGSERKKDVCIADLLPKDLDPISPESDETKKSDASVEDGELDDAHIEDEESPPFEAIAEVNDNSVGSHLSGISGLTSPDDQHSNISYNGAKTPPQPMSLGINNDSQLSKVSSGSHLSFNFGETDKPAEQIEQTEQYSPMNIESNDSNSKSSFVESGGEVIEKFEAARIRSDTSGSSDDQGKVTTTTENVEMDTDSDSSSSSSSDSDSARPIPSPGLGSCDEGYGPVVKQEPEERMEKDTLPVPERETPAVVERKEEIVVKESKGEEKSNKIVEKEAVFVMKKEREEHKPLKYDKEEKKAVKKDGKEEERSTKDIAKDDEKVVKKDKEERSTKDIAKDDEKVVKKDKEVKKSVRSDKEVTSVKKHKDGDKLVQKDKNDAKVDEKEKKEAGIDPAKKHEKGKDLKYQDKERSVKRDDKDKKLSKSEGSKEDIRVSKDKSVKRSEEKEKSVKKEEKDKEHKSGKVEEKRKADVVKGHDGKHKDSSVSSHLSHKSDREKHHSSKSKKHEDGDKSSRTDTGISKHATKEDKERKDEKTRSDDKQKPKNGKVDKEKSSKPDEKSSKDKDRRVKEKEEIKVESSKHDRERKDSKSKSSSDKSKDGGKRKDKSKPTDDHDKHREKRSEDRRSTDRDSNGTTRDRSSSSSHATSTSAKDAQRHENKGGGKTNNGGNSEASETTSKGSKKDSAEMPLSPKSPLKRPLDVGEEYFCTSNEGKLTLKIKKPKIAANIFEVQKIMELRRSLAKLEMKRQQELSEVEKQSVETGRDTMAKSEQSTPDDVPRKRVASESDDDAEDVKYFETYDENKNSEFVAFVKRLGRSRKLSEIDVSSVSSNDLDYISDSELPDIEHLPPRYGLFPFPLVEYVPYSSTTIDSVIDAVSRGLTSDSPPSPIQETRMSTSDVQSQMLPHLVLSKLKTGTVYEPESDTSRITSTPLDSTVTSKVSEVSVGMVDDSVKSETAVTETTCAEMKPPQISPSSSDKRETRRSRKPNTKYSSNDYSFVSDDNDLDEPEIDKRRAVSSLGKSPAAKRQKLVSGDASLMSSLVRHPVDNNNKDEAVGETKKTEQVKEVRLSAARRVGLSRPKVAAVTQVARVATPDFVMPLSPESDVSASSSELAKKSLAELPSPSTSEEEAAASGGAEENKGTYRRGGVPVSGQRYCSDDLYKPRPLFNRVSRRKRVPSPASLQDAAPVNGVVPSDPSEAQQLARRQR